MTRINEFLMLPAPDRPRILRYRRAIVKIRTALLVGPAEPVDEPSLSENLLGLLASLQRRTRNKQAGLPRRL